MCHKTKLCKKGPLNNDTVKPSHPMSAPAMKQSGFDEMRTTPLTELSFSTFLMTSPNSERTSLLSVLT